MNTLYHYSLKAKSTSGRTPGISLSNTPFIPRCYLKLYVKLHICNMKLHISSISVLRSLRQSEGSHVCSIQTLSLSPLKFLIRIIHSITSTHSTQISSFVFSFNIIFFLSKKPASRWCKQLPSIAPKQCWGLSIRKFKSRGGKK